MSLNFKQLIDQKNELIHVYRNKKYQSITPSIFEEAKPEAAG